MTYNTGNKDVEKGWSSIYSIWLSMLGALFFYLVFGLFIKDRVNLGISDDTVVIIRYGLYTVSVVTFILAGFLKNRILGSGITGRKYPHFSDNDAVSKYTTATVVSLALAESIAICGLALFLIGKNELDLYILVFASGVSMIYNRPFKDELHKLDDELKKSR